MTSFMRKIPFMIGMFFFAVAAFFTIYNGGQMIEALTRGAIAAGISGVFGSLLSYLVFYEEIPDPEPPDELPELKGKFKRTSW